MLGVGRDEDRAGARQMRFICGSLTYSQPQKYRYYVYSPVPTSTHVDPVSLLSAVTWGLD